MVTNAGVGLADAIESVKAELRDAQDRGRGSDIRFSVGPVEIEFLVEVVKTGGAEASIKVLNVLSLGGKAGLSAGETNRVKVTLTPIEVGGAPFEVASAQARRPDAPAGGGAADQLARPGG